MLWINCIFLLGNFLKGNTSNGNEIPVTDKTRQNSGGSLQWSRVQRESGENSQYPGCSEYQSRLCSAGDCDLISFLPFFFVEIILLWYTVNYHILESLSVKLFTLPKWAISDIFSLFWLVFQIKNTAKIKRMNKKQLWMLTTGWICRQVHLFISDLNCVREIFCKTIN